MRDSQGKLLGAILSIRDTQGQRRAEADQRRTEQRFQLLVESAQEGLWSVDANNRTTYVNRYFAEMLGYTVEEMMEKTLFDIIRQEDIRPHAASTSRSGARAKSAVLHDFRLVRKDGTLIWTLVSTGPLLRGAATTSAPWP